MSDGADPRIVGSFENNQRHIARARAFIARRQPTPEETTVSETDASTEADRCDCDEWPCEHNPSGIAEVVRLIRTLRRPEHDPECAHYGTWHAINGSCSCGVACAPGCHMTIEEPAPTPAPRTVTVDLSLPLRDRLTSDEQDWLDHVFNEYVLPDVRLHSGAYFSLRAALDRSDTGGQG